MPMDEAHNDNNSNNYAALLAELQALELTCTALPSESQQHRPAQQGHAG